MIPASTLEDAFPEINPGKRPFGGRVMVQLRTVREKTAGGIVLVEDTKQFNKANTRMAKVVAKGPLAYCNRETGEPWTEGVWGDIGEFVTIPQFGGSRFERKIPGTNDTATFATFNDYELIEGVDPDAFEELDELL